MLFNSISYFIFLVTLIIIYFSIPHKYRLYSLTLASYFFYSYWKPIYTLVLLFSTFIDFIIGKNIYITTNKKKKKILLFISVFVNLGVLIYFKYLFFFSEILYDFSHFNIFNINNNILLPIGISFYTFQSLSYSIDIYRNKITPEPSFINFATFVSFFPQLVSGPIERANKLLPQLRNLSGFSTDSFINGIKRIIIGLFKKIIIADKLALFVDTVYNNPTDYNGLILIIVTYFFAIQIYCDFSGYCDIAIGTARIFNINLTENFKRPYFSKNIKEFWSRWHITLCSWFKDYLYISIGGNRVKRNRWIINILIVFLLSGLWHGANYNFIFWGLLHGVYYLVGNLTHNLRRKLFYNSIPQKLFGVLKPLQIIITFNLVCISWIFFRANSINQAYLVCIKISSIIDNFEISLQNAFYNLHNIQYNFGISQIEFYIYMFLLIFFIALEVLDVYRNIYENPNPKHIKIYELIILNIMIISIIMFGAINQQPFIYFQF